MDEVDFTILAATSVLGDLIEKCPPAEACRDAFDRMSKATVQMCMSTTGFGSSAGALNSSNRRSHHQHQQPSPDHSANAQGDYFVNDRQYQRHVNPAPPKTRPVPQFDMALNDLLGPSEVMQTPQQSFRPNPQSAGVKGEYDQFGNPSPLSRQNTNTNANTIHSLSPSEYNSPPLSTLDSVIDPALMPSPSTATGQYAQQVQATYAQAPYQEFDFLQAAAGGGNGWETDAAGDWGMGLGNVWGTAGTEGGDHDFSEGGNGGVDLFDGFFFGGTGNF